MSFATTRRRSCIDRRTLSCYAWTQTVRSGHRRDGERARCSVGLRRPHMATPNQAMGSLYIVRDTMTAVQEPKAGEPIKAGAAKVKGRGRSVYSSFDCVDHFGAGFDYV